MTDLVGKQLGQYEIRGVIGQGGMATVYKGYQPSMEREVAVKVINMPLINNPEFIKRFESEVRLIAHLQHVNILPVYDFGREDGTLYLVMRLVEGGSLDQRLRQGALPLAQAAKIFTQIAGALTYAHQEGVVHRDLKPNNILMDKSGNPYLTDFGIAKMIQNTGSLTATGTTLGTPAYMSPEQWRGSNVDGRADIYALGIMLYEMLTGVLPFTGDTPYILMYKHFDEFPPSITQHIPGIPEGVNAVIQQALAKNPEDRFSVAVEMADALNAAIMGTGVSGNAGNNLNNLNNEKTFIDVQPIPVTTQLPKPTYTVEPTTKAAESATQPEATLPQKVRRRWVIPVAALILVVVVLAVAALVISAPGRQPFHLISELSGHHEPVQSLTWSPDSTRLASASEDKTVRIWDVATGKNLFTLRGPTDEVYSIAWSPDGTKLAAGSIDTNLYIWNPDKGELIATLQANTADAINSIAWSPDSKSIVVGSPMGKVVVWDVEAQKIRYSVKHSDTFWMPVAWGYDGKTIAAAGKDNSVEILDAATGNVIQTINAQTEFVYAVDWSHDNSRLITNSHDGVIHTWDMRAKNPTPLVSINGSDSGVTSARWSPDGNKIASSSGFTNLGGIDDNLIKIWDAQNGSLLYTLEGNKGPVAMAVWSPDGTKLAGAGADTIVRIWSTDK